MSDSGVDVLDLTMRLAALDHGDLVRIVLVMDSHLERMRDTLRSVKLQSLREHYNRLVTTRNKVQAAWRATLPKPARKKPAKKKRK